jgi:hypothetical protein
MTIELPREIETQLTEAAREQGISVGEYVEGLVTETNRKRAQISEFQAAVAERMESLDSGCTADGEAVMDQLISELAPQ